MDTGNLLASLIIFTCGYVCPGPPSSSCDGTMRGMAPPARAHRGLNASVNVLSRRPRQRAH
jgi:hypothetical protein